MTFDVSVDVTEWLGNEQYAFVPLRRPRGHHRDAGRTADRTRQRTDPHADDRCGGPDEPGEGQCHALARFQPDPPVRSGVGGRTSRASSRRTAERCLPRRAWWRSAVIYQVYLRSFADGNGDGVGDIAGLRSRLGYVRDLGVDAIWINPWYPSPMADAGYDVIDQRDIDPAYGTLAEAEALIAEAHDHGLRVILDVVPNHTSELRAWFQEALVGGPGSRARPLPLPQRTWRAR